MTSPANQKQYRMNSSSSATTIYPRIGVCLFVLPPELLAYIVPIPQRADSRGKRFKKPGLRRWKGSRIFTPKINILCGVPEGPALGNRPQVTGVQQEFASWLRWPNDLSNINFAPSPHCGILVDLHGIKKKRNSFDEPPEPQTGARNSSALTIVFIYRIFTIYDL